MRKPKCVHVSGWLLSPARICNLVKRGGEVIVHAGTNNMQHGRAEERARQANIAG